MSLKHLTPGPIDMSNMLLVWMEWMEWGVSGVQWMEWIEWQVWRIKLVKVIWTLKGKHPIPLTI